MLKYLLLYRYSVLVGFFSGLVLYFIQKFPIWWFFVGALIVWLGVLFFLLLHFSKKNSHYKEVFILVIFTALAFVSLLILVEWKFLRPLIILAGAIFIGFLYAYPVYKLFADKYDLKPWRRVLMMVWVFDVYAIQTLLFAFNLFFSEIPFAVYALVGTLVFSGVSLLVWQMYFERPAKLFLPWMLIVGVVSFEFLWVGHFLPWGYLVLGFLITWLWYLMHLFVRFHLTEKGVVWDKQKWFLLSNAILYVFFLVFVVRWI